MACNSCCSYPNGHLTIVPCLLSIVAYILTSISLWSCQYAETDYGRRVGIMSREPSTSDYWFTDDRFTEQCIPYTSDYNQFYDTNFKAAQGLGLTTWIVGFVMIIVVWSVAPCVASPKVGWRIIGAMFFLMGGCQLFTLLFLASNICSSGCELKTGGVASIFASLFWWATAGICFLIPDATRERDVGLPQFSPQRALAVGELVQQPSETPIVAMATETTMQRVEADGTIVAETVKSYPDGRTTVTTSIIPPAAAAVAQVPAVHVVMPASASAEGNPNSDFEKR
mmetsp:Transcript_19862/g.30111  ORF Transcript_19862/g.30111 Transcript_19862/m.30111 type:complete len:283 (+) Transcript_19862:233-1081(+)